MLGRKLNALPLILAPAIMPLSKFTDNLSSMSYNKTDKIVVMCKAGLNSETARLIQLEKWLPACMESIRRVNFPAETQINTIITIIKNG
jgi:hypothetical protein